MDKNLAPGSAVGVNEDRVSTHTTEETQNYQDDLCHNVLTGKVLAPAPIAIPDGGASVTFTAAGDSGLIGAVPLADGFTLQYVYDDWYYLDMAAVEGEATVTATDEGWWDLCCNKVKVC